MGPGTSQGRKQGRTASRAGPEATRPAATRAAKQKRKGARARATRPGLAAAGQALLALSRALADARSEDDIVGALASALEVLFPGRAFAVRLVDPASLALRTFYASGRLRVGANARLSLRRAAIERTGLSRAALEDAGLVVTERDELLFADSASAVVVPLAVGGELLGVVNLESPAGGRGENDADVPLLCQLANHAALGIRNVRQLEELTALKSYLAVNTTPLVSAAEHAERLAGIGRLVAGVVHELNNPLTAIAMYSDVLVEKFQSGRHDQADLEKLRAIRDSGHRIQRLARDLVAYARPAGARVERVALADVLEEAVRLANPALEEKAASVERRFEEVPRIEGSRPALVQVFVNLVTNAAQAVGEGGRIALRLTAGDGAVRVVVEDGGAGMDATIAARAFEPFFTTGAGIGLGLPIVQGIVERHGGEVALRTAPGAGTEVTVTLPVRRGG